MSVTRPGVGVTSNGNVPVPPCVILVILRPPSGGALYAFVYVHVTCSFAARPIVTVTPDALGLLVQTLPDAAGVPASAG